MINREKLRQWSTRIDALQLRERLLILVTVVILTYGVIDLLLLSPLQLRMKQSEQSLIDWQSKLAIVEQQTRDLSSTQDPLASQRTIIDSLQQEIANHQGRLEARMGNLLSNGEAPKLLHDLIDSQHNLRLISLNTQQNGHTAEASEDGLSIGFNRYNLELNLEGSYLDTLRFVQGIESSEWQLFWDGLKLDIVEHPKANIQIQLYTLGTGI